MVVRICSLSRPFIAINGNRLATSIPPKISNPSIVEIATCFALAIVKLLHRPIRDKPFNNIF